MRYKLLHWLRYKIARCKEGEISPKWIRFIYWVLFPLNWFYERQSGIKYDHLNDIYFIRGMKFSGIIFEMLRHQANEGKVFRLKEADGKTATVEELHLENSLPKYKPSKMPERQMRKFMNRAKE